MTWLRRWWLAPVALLVLAGCESPGMSGLSDELARQRGEVGFAVVRNSEHRAVFAVNGRQVAVEPPEGYCLDEEAIAVSRRSAFALVTDCMESQEAALANGDSGETLPRTFPGILTVTVSGEAAFGEEPGALAAFQSLLGTEAGGRLLGRGDGSGPGRVVAAKRVGGTLYVLIEEARAEGSESIFAPGFWRAFTEINGRLVLVTVSGFNDRPLGEDEMLAFLASQITRLREANGLEPGAGEEQIASAVMAELQAIRSAEREAAQSEQAPRAAPMPPRRRG